ncbi:MAG: type II secretion system protein [Burkholderiales bacterium]|jgi:hypothetical protein|nr:type II secretion system protein [Burkholderiales bacterium]
MQPCRLKLNQYQFGFSYLWVLLLVALMGVALDIVIEIDTTLSQRDKEKSLIATGRQFQRAIASYYETQQAGGKKEYPSSLEDLLLDPRYPNVKRHLRKVFVDPITGKADWGVIRVGGRIVAIHSLSQSKPIKQENFEPEFGHFQNAQKYSDWIFAYPTDIVINVSNTPILSNGSGQSGTSVKGIAR